MPVLVAAFLLTRAVAESALAIGVAQAIYLVAPVLATVFSVAVAWVAPPRTRTRIAWSLLAAIFGILLIGETYAAWGLTFVFDSPAAMGSVFDIANFTAAGLFVVLLAVSSGLERLGVRRAIRMLLCAVIFIGSAFMIVLELLSLDSGQVASRLTPETIRVSLYAALGAFILAGALFLTWLTRVRSNVTSNGLLIPSVTAFALGMVVAPLATEVEFLGATGLFADRASAALMMLGYYLAFLAALKQLRSPFAPWTSVNDIRLRQPTVWFAVSLELFSVAAVVWASTLLGVHGPTQPLHTQERIYFWVIACSFVLLTTLTVADTDWATQRALIDPITRCPNALALTASVADACRQDVITGQSLTTLLMIDLDDMARVNARLGFSEGDRLLKEITHDLRAVLPSGATLFRGYGDELIVLTRSIAAADTDKLSVSIREIVRSAGSEHEGITASVGISSTGPDVGCGEALLASASTATRWAKRQGKNASVTFHETLASEPWRLREDMLDSDIALPEIVAALITAIEANDQSLSGHARRVARSARALGSHLGMDPAHVQRLELAALLHDVGMMMLHDPSVGTDDVPHDERHKHAVVGAELVAAIGILDIAHWIAAHHEYWNGTGGPAGTQGERIPVEARIISLADAFDFYTAPPPHGLGFSRAAGLQQLDLEMGVRFDPELTDRFISVIAASGSESDTVAGDV